MVLQDAERMLEQARKKKVEILKMIEEKGINLEDFLKVTITIGYVCNLSFISYFKSSFDPSVPFSVCFFPLIQGFKIREF